MGISLTFRAGPQTEAPINLPTQTFNVRYSFPEEKIDINFAPGEIWVIIKELDKT